MITADDFTRWRDDAVTRWVFRAIEAGEEQNKAAWHEASWGASPGRLIHPANQAQLASLLLELRTRADAYRALIDTDYEGWCETNGDEPVYDK